MTLHVYKLNDTIHADGVDMKRVARSLLKEWGTQAAGPLPPMRDLSDAMEVIARSFGYRNLHECQRVASAAGSPVALAPVESSRPNPGLDAGALTARIVDVHTLIAGESRIRRNEMLAEMASQEITRGGGLVILDAGPGGRIFDRIQASAKSAKRNLNVLDPRASAAAEPKPFEVSLNPFVSGTVKELTQLLNRLAGHGTERPDVWEAKTQRFIPALMQVLVRMRDRDGVLINAQAIANCLQLEHAEWLALVNDKCLPQGDISAVKTAKWRDIFTNNVVFDVPRFQLVTFSVVVGFGLLAAGADIADLSIFSIPSQLLSILGLSQVVYVAGKLVAPPSVSDLNAQIVKVREAEGVVAKAQAAFDLANNPQGTPTDVQRKALDDANNAAFTATKDVARTAFVTIYQIPHNTFY